MDRLEVMSMLIKVVEVGSFSAASKALNIPLPTLSRKISELEKQLGIRLLHRTTRKLSLTASGVDYLAACKRILEQVEEAERSVKGEYAEPRGELIITAPVMFGKLYVLPIVNEFLSLYSNINVQLILSDGNINLYENEVDMAIRIGELPDSSMIATQVGKIRVVTCANQQLLNAHKQLLSPHDLIALPSISLNITKSLPDWSYMQPDTKVMFNIKMPARLTVTDTEAAVNAAICGVGVTQQLHYQVKSAVDKGLLNIILAEFEPSSVPVNLMHKSRKYMPQKMKSFLDFASPKLKNKINQLTV
ncbi:LysR family transcriptional regulator [Colwellia sp. E2M01]|uniref:LysR family transcriptional regulator n=1 Tax=Colwellia sp. E2M01 TaxID=2841561 RepID=UPI001C086831|nr:LysR family transcriptional regulator [Colwellia sp. E2M01]MBU2872181.1 LysR family transcriptional regulator [Colwellia sp. E2M01]